MTYFVVVFELALSLLVTWPLVWQMGFAPFRRRSPCKVTSRIVLVGGYCLFLALAAYYYPPVLHVVAFLAAAFLICERWRARPTYGRSWGLPPGSLGLMPSGIMRDPYFIEKQIAKYGPIFKTSRDFHPFICLYGHERGLKFLREHDESLLGKPMPFNHYIPKGFIRCMGPAVHTKYRKLFVSGISSQTIDQCTPFLAATVRETLNRFAEDCSHSSTGRLDPDTYLREMICSSFVPLFFGIQRESQLFVEVQSLYEIINTRRNLCGTDRKKRRATENLIELIAQRANLYAENLNKGNSVPACFLRELLETDVQAAQDHTVLGNLIYMVEIGGLNDTASLIRWILKILMEHPSWMTRLRETGEDTHDGTDKRRNLAAERIVKETLRLQQMEFLLRRNTRDIVFEGYRIPKNWSVRICIREGNRDPDVFAAPEAFDPDRFLDRKYSNVEYSGFGLFRHSCLGAYLTQVFCSNFILELVDGFELKPAADWEAEHGKSHWIPRRGYQISLRHRAETVSGHDDQVALPC